MPRDFSAAANAAARSRQPVIGTTPVSLGASAPRSMAGTARSSSGPSASPVNATRIGWNSVRPFLTGPIAHALRGSAKRLARLEPGHAAELVGQNVHNLTGAVDRELGSNL